MTKRRKTKAKRRGRKEGRKTGLTLKGKLRKGYRFAKGGRVVKARKKR